MPPFFSLIREINPTKRECMLKLRLIHIYSVPTFGDISTIYSLECIFQDKEGAKIHATIKQQHIEKFKPMLKDNHLYAVKDFIVADNVMRYKTTVGKYKLMFLAKTAVREFFDENFPCNIFDFKPFQYFSNPDEVEESLLIDVIGKIVSRNSPQIKEVAGRQAKMIDIVLEDAGGETLSCTLWGEFVDNLMNHLASINDDPVIIILQFCRAKKFKDVIRVSNAFFVSKVIIDGDIKEIEDFRSSLSSEKKAMTSESNIALPTLPVAQTIEEEFENTQELIRTIEQLRETKEVGSYWVYARIDFIDCGKNWWYISCKQCPKKMIPAGGSFYCDKCDKFDSIGKVRYKLQVRVVDSTGNPSFLLWDKESNELIGISATELKEIAEGQIIPDEIGNLIDKKVIFKIQIKPHQVGIVYTVIKLVLDNSTIDKYFGQFDGNQESDFLQKLEVADIKDLHEPGASNAEAPIAMKKTGKTSISRDVSNSNLKRSLLDEFSTTSKEKMTKVEVKIEKE